VSIKSIHPSVFALLKEAKAGETAEDIMIRKCRKLVLDAKNKGWEGTPHYDPEMLAGMLGIKVVSKPATAEIGGEAALIPVRGRLEIWIKEGVTPERRRFSICHEIAHTQFPNYTKRRHNHMASTSLTQAEREMESLCDIGASEILLPAEDFDQVFDKTQFCGQALVSLSSHFLASIEATVRRVIKYGQWPGAAVLVTDNDTPRSKCGLKVKYSIAHPSFKPYPRPNGPIPVKCVAYNCLETKKIEQQARLFWHVSGLMQNWKVEAVPLPKIEIPEAPKAVILLHP
jgi:Zn-dependent peptidase ImmA (M78 family)